MRLIYLFILSCFLGYAQNPDYSVAQIPEELKENADAVFRQDFMEIEINSIKNMTTRVTNVWTVLNSQGNKLINNSIYHNNSIKINKAEVKIYNASGKEIRKFKKKEFKDRSSVSSGTLYSDAREMYVDYTPTSYPYTFEITYETTSKNTVFLPNFYFLSAYRLSTQDVKLSIFYNPNELELKTKEQNLELIKVNKTTTPGSIHYETQNLTAITKEILSPDFYDFTPQVKFAPKKFVYEGVQGEASNWIEFGEWFYHNLFKGRDKVSEKTLLEVKQLVKGVDDPIERARLVYEYVQNNTRYISVQVGIGGYQPIPADEVDLVKYGDCKGLSNYTKALFEAVGVPAYYTHINSGNNQKNLDPDFYSMTQANHVILAIPNGDDYIYTDCTSQIHPFGFIGDFSDNRYAHIIKPDGGKLVKTTAYLNEDNLESYSIKGILDDDGQLTASLEITSRGLDYDRKLYLPIFSSLEIDTHYKKRWSNIRNLQVSNIQFENDKREVVFKEQVEISAKNYASKSGDRFILEINPFSKYTSVPPRYEKRTQPILIKRGFYETTTFDLTLPEGYEIEAMPTVLNTSSSFGDYEVNIQENEDHSLSFTRQFLLKAGTYPKDSYSDFRDFLSKVATQDNLKIVLIKK